MKALPPNLTGLTASHPLVSVRLWTFYLDDDVTFVLTQRCNVNIPGSTHRCYTDLDGKQHINTDDFT